MKRVLFRAWIGWGALLGGVAQAQVTEVVSVNSAGEWGNYYSYNPAISANGRFVAFQSRAWNLGLPFGGGSIFLRDRQAGTTVGVSVDSAGGSADGESFAPSISGDGRYVAFESKAGNLGVSNPNHWYPHVYVHDQLTGTTVCGDVDDVGNPSVAVIERCSSLSGDGRYVSFATGSGLVPGDVLDNPDVYRHDLQTGSTDCASVDSSGAFGNGSSWRSALSWDGRFVAFASTSTNLVPSDTNGAVDVFVHDFQTGATIRVSVNSLGQEGNGPSGDFGGVSISHDGGVVGFVSAATNLGLPTTNWLSLFVHEVATGRTSMANFDSSGVVVSVPPTYDHGLSGDGRFIAFTSESIRVVPGDTNANFDVFLRDLRLGVTTRESVGSSGVQGNGISWGSAFCVSGDGRFVTFQSQAPNLVAGDAGDFFDIFVRDREPSTATAFCPGDGSQSACPCGNSGEPYRGCENSAATGGAVLAATGRTSLGGDTFRVTSFGERSHAFSLFFQGTLAISPTAYGDGLRCVGGTLKRLYAKSASLGVVSAPQATDPSISARSAELNDPIVVGATRYYQVQYRDASASFCPDPPGDTWNVSNALAAVWDP